METSLELDVLIFPDEVRVASPEDLIEWELETASQLSRPPVRLFVALYPYNPAAMSPNHETAAEELPFVPGQIIKVITGLQPLQVEHFCGSLTSVSCISCSHLCVHVQSLISCFYPQPSDVNLSAVINNKK